MELDLQALKQKKEAVAAFINPESIKTQLECTYKHYQPIDWKGIPDSEREEYDALIAIQSSWQVMLVRYELLLKAIPTIRSRAWYTRKYLDVEERLNWIEASYRALIQN